MKPNLEVAVIGGTHSGKSDLAKIITKALKKYPRYGVQMQDGEITMPLDPGPIKVLVKTVYHDPVMDPSVTAEGPPLRAVGLAELKAAFLQWRLDELAGRCKTKEEGLVLPAGQFAEENAQAFWAYLNT